MQSNVETKGKLKIASQIRSVTAAVKAFESLKKNVLLSRSKLAISLKSKRFREVQLKQKVFGAFAKVLTNRLISFEV